MAGGSTPGGGPSWLAAFLAGAAIAIVAAVVAFVVIRDTEEAHAGDPIECSMMDSTQGDADCDAWGTMSAETMIVPPGEMSFVEMDRTGTSVLVYEGAEPMAVGSIVVTETEEGPFYGRVSSMEGAEVVTDAASLFDIYPDLDLDVDVDEPDVEGAESIAVMDESPIGQFVDVGADGGDIVEGFRGAPASRAARPSRAELNCDVAVAATLGVNVEPRVGTFDLKVRGPSDVRASYRPSLTVGVEASLGGAAECTVTQQLFATRLPSIRFFLGPVPVWIEQQLGVEANGSVSTSQSITAGVSVTATADLGVEYRNGRFSARAQGTARLDRDLTIESAFNSSLEFPVVYRASLYGLVFVEPRVGPFTDLAVQPLASTWLTLDAGLRGRVRMGVDLPWPLDDPAWTSPPWDIYRTNLVSLNSNPPTTPPVPTSPPSTSTPPVATSTTAPSTPTSSTELLQTSTTDVGSTPPVPSTPPLASNPPPPLAFVPDVDTYYRLATIQSRESGACLEGNQVVEGASLGGASFMAACQGPTGQAWRFLPEPGGTYRLQTRQLEASGQCLDGGRFGVDGSPAGGAAHMAACGAAATQQWTLVPLDDGGFQLRSGTGQCLEGNRLDANSTLGGAAFLASCGAFAGMIWDASPIP